MIIKNMINKDYKNALTELCNVKQQILKLENEVLKIEEILKIEEKLIQELIDTTDQSTLNQNTVSKPIETKNAELRKCKNDLCNNFFETTKQKIYCKRQCKTNYNNYLRKKISIENQIFIQCANDNCQETFAKNGIKKYCSKECNIKLKKTFIPFDRQCKWCNENFTIKSFHQNAQIFCKLGHKNKYSYNAKKIKKAKEIELLAMETKPITNPVVAKIKIVKNDKLQQKPIIEKSLPIKIITKKPKQEIIKNVSKIINNIDKLYIPNRNNKQNNSLKLSNKPMQKELELYLIGCIENYTTSYKNNVKTIARRLYNEEFLLNSLKERIKKCNGKISYLQLACFIDNPFNYLDTIE